MRINVVMGFFLPIPPVAGGALEKAWFRLAGEFTRAGHDVTIVSRRVGRALARERRPEAAMVRVRGFDHTARLPVNLTLDGLWGARVLRHLPPADVTVCNTVSLPVHLSWTRPRAGRVVAVLGRMPKGQTRWYGRVSRLLAISAAVAERVAVECPSAAPRTRVVPLPIDWALLSGPSARDGEVVTIGYVGRLHPEKGIELLLRAACRLADDPTLPAWRLVLRGPGDVRRGGGGESYVAGLRAEFDGRLGDRVRWEPPEFDDAKLARCYGAIDLFCYPSLAERGEALGVAPLEAMAAGATPVVSRLPCFDEMLSDGLNGLTFDHRAADPAGALADVLRRLVRDRVLRERLGARAQQDVRRFDDSVVGAALLEDFLGLAG